MGIKDIARRGGEYYILPPDEIRKLKIKTEDDFRTNESINENVVHLKSLIRENGYYKDKAVTIYADGEDYYVDDGRCRTRAVVELLDEGVEIAGLPVILDDKFMSPEERLFRSFARNEGRKFSPLESSNLFKRLYNLGWSPAEISRKANVSFANVQAMLELSAAPAEILKHVEEGHIAATTVVQAMREYKSEAPALINMVVSDAKAEAAAEVEHEPDEGAESSGELPLTEEDAPKKKGRPKGVKNKKPKVTKAKVDAYAAQLRGETVPEQPVSTAPSFVVSPELWESVENNEKDKLLLELAGYILPEGADYWGLESELLRLVKKAQDLVGVPESV